jgi:hypothetical protein
MEIGKMKKPTNKEIRLAFETTVNYIGSDFAQVCEECGEEPGIHRESVEDYLGIHGGEHGEALFECLCEGTITEDDLDKAGVPKFWHL